MTRHNKSLAVSTEIERAHDSLRSAETLLGAGLYNDSISRAYYSVFHMACATLLTQGLEAKSHAGVRTLFNLHFVKTEKIEHKYLKLLTRMQAHREEADYTSKIVFQKAAAQKLFEDAKAFRSAMMDFIRSSGFERL